MDAQLFVFDEVPLKVAGACIAYVNGTFQVSAAGQITEIVVDTWERAPLKPHHPSIDDPLQDAVFAALSAEIKAQYAGQITDWLAECEQDEVDWYSIRAGRDPYDPPYTPIVL